MLQFLIASSSAAETGECEVQRQGGMPSLPTLPHMLPVQVVHALSPTLPPCPVEVGTLSQLQTLNLYSNPSLSGTIPVEVGELSQLQ